MSAVYYFHRYVRPHPEALRLVANRADVFEYQFQRASVACADIHRGLQVFADGLFIEVGPCQQANT